MLSIRSIVGGMSAPSRRVVINPGDEGVLASDPRAVVRPAASDAGEDPTTDDDRSDHRRLPTTTADDDRSDHRRRPVRPPTTTHSTTTHSTTTHSTTADDDPLDDHRRRPATRTTCLGGLRKGPTARPAPTK
jgi:hypothetical protein